MSDQPAWEQRFRTPILSFPAWADGDPDRLVIASTESGSYQLHAWDRRTGRRRQVTTDPVGVLEGRPTRDGTGVVWFRDETGDETGTFVIAPFDEDLAPEPLLTGLPKGWPDGLAIGRRRTVAAISTESAFSVWVSDDGDDVRLLHTHAQPVRLAAGSGMSGAVDRAALSADDAVVVLEVMDDGDVLHPSLRSVDTVTGETLAELRDPGLELAGFGFSPVPGDLRMAITHERIGERRPALWHARTGELTDLPVDLPGAVEPVGWWPDGGALLLLVLRAGPSPALPVRAGDRRHDPLETEPGSITAAAVRPDGSVWYRGHNGEHPARLLEVGSDVPLLEADGPGRTRRTAVRGLVVREPARPAGPRLPGPPRRRRPAPGDDARPRRAALGGHGPLGARTSWPTWTPGSWSRWSTTAARRGSGRRGATRSPGTSASWSSRTSSPAWTTSSARGLADPARVVLAGWSWGGYVTLLGAGRHPDRWASLIAGVPVADYVAAYEDESPMLQALDRALFGGSPAEVPDLFAERNPITYVDAVEAPLLILAGENDSRCPIRQVWNYVGRLRERGVEPRVYTYATGHASFDIEERVRQTAIVLDHLAATVPGARAAREPGRAPRGGRHGPRAHGRPAQANR